jgi:hypothetical protein
MVHLNIPKNCAELHLNGTRLCLGHPQFRVLIERQQLPPPILYALTSKGS